MEKALKDKDIHTTPTNYWKKRLTLSIRKNKIYLQFDYD